MILQYPKLVESKTSAQEVSTIEWNPGMDLLATVFTNGALTCSRLLSLQKVWHKPPCGKVISIAWRPDGRVLAIGAYNEKTKENICTLHDVEDGKEINSIICEHEITTIAWFSCSPVSEQKDKEDPIRPKKRMTSPMLPNENFSHQLAHKQTDLNILMISTSDGRMGFYALGLFYLGNMLVHNEANSKIIKTHMSSCMRFITSIVTIQNTNSTQTSLRVFKLDTFQSRSSEILRIAKMYAKITDELEYLDDTLSAITTSWTDVLAGLDNKLSSYCSRKLKRPDESSSSYTFISADDLLQLLVLGFPSDNLEKFLADMSDKGLRKLNNAIEQTCQRVQNLIVKNAQKVCYHLHNDLNLLRGMSLWHERFTDVGLEDKSIVEAMQDVGSLMLKLTELQQVIDHSLKSTKSFFRWLISVACRMSGEQNNSVVPNDVNKTTQQDIQLITDFILENFDYNSNVDELGSLISKESGEEFGVDPNWSSRPTCSNFTLEQVGQYLKNEPLSRLKYSFAKPGSNFWIDFFKDRAELAKPRILEEDGSSVLLFYSHRSDTSLIQEHKSACKSIETAFKSVASNIKLVLDHGINFTHLKDFVRNAPSNKIRIETDIRSMQHYVLFQTKMGLVSKQYLISQSLVDKSFKLLSLEFHSVNMNTSRQSTSRSSTSSGLLMITDSSFYEIRETKSTLISFLLLDQTSSDTLIVQIDLQKLVSNPNCIERNHKDVNKIFRTNESIDKQSVQIVLKLDLSTEPAHERKHEPEMMVKRIKGVAGRDMFSSSSRGVIAFTSCDNKRIHLYELEAQVMGSGIYDDELGCEDQIDESLIDNELIG